MLLSNRAPRSGIHRHRWTKPVYEVAARARCSGAAKVATALERIAAGNLSNVKTVGGGVLEYRVDFGPGYRIYFGRDGDRLVILLAGGTKKRQRQDIRQAKVNWEDYRSRKTEEKTRCP